MIHLRKLIFLISLILIASCTTSKDPAPVKNEINTTQSNYNIVGAWEGKDSNFRLPLNDYKCQVIISSNKIVLIFDNNKPIARTNPTIFDYKYMFDKTDKTPSLKISETYSWDIVFVDETTVTITTNNGEDIYYLTKQK